MQYLQYGPETVESHCGSMPGGFKKLQKNIIMMEKRQLIRRNVQKLLPHYSGAANTHQDQGAASPGPKPTMRGPSYCA